MLATVEQLDWRPQSIPVRCDDCGSDLLSWGQTIKSSAPAGNMLHRTSEMTVVMYLGCCECSHTLLNIGMEDFCRLHKITFGEL